MLSDVNSFISEAVVVVSTEVIDNDTTIATGVGQFDNVDLNLMLPVIDDNLLSSIRLLNNRSYLLVEK